MFFLGIKGMHSVHPGGYNVIVVKEGTVYLMGLVEQKEATRFVLNPNWNLVQSYWYGIERICKFPWLTIQKNCDFYGNCGLFESCTSLDSPICLYLRGFEPKNNDEWEKKNIL